MGGLVVSKWRKKRRPQIRNGERGGGVSGERRKKGDALQD